MGAGVSQQVLSRAALKRLRALQYGIGQHRPELTGRAAPRYLNASKSRYGVIEAGHGPAGVTFSVNVTRASNGEAFMNLVAFRHGSAGTWEAKPVGHDDLQWALGFLPQK